MRRSTEGLIGPRYLDGKQTLGVTAAKTRAPRSEYTRRLLRVGRGQKNAENDKETAGS